MLLVLNCIPFLKVYENFYTESNYQLRKDIFDIQSDFLADGEKSILKPSRNITGNRGIRQ